jgi:serine/threonine protein kinase
LLHNELIGELYFSLKAKMAYQAAKGMHFLHSSGIVHRDLKSLNLLLDNKWNVKVSDFGLTKFNADLHKHKRGSGAHGAMGSVHWMAPEVLSESPDVDYVLADVYSFGVILWELLTRQEPYQGMRYIPLSIVSLPTTTGPDADVVVVWCAARRRSLWR